MVKIRVLNSHDMCFGFISLSRLCCIFLYCHGIMFWFFQHERNSLLQEWLQSRPQCFHFPWTFPKLVKFRWSSSSFRVFFITLPFFLHVRAMNSIMQESVIEKNMEITIRFQEITDTISGYFWVVETLDWKSRPIGISFLALFHWTVYNNVRFKTVMFIFYINSFFLYMCTSAVLARMFSALVVMY